MTLEEELEQDEGYSQFPYRDSVRSVEHPEGIWTVGIGRNLEEVGIYHDEAIFMLRNDISKRRFQLEQKLKYWSLLPGDIQEVLINMSFMGVGRLMGFTEMLKAVAKIDREGMAKEMMDSLWADQVKGRAVRLKNKILSGGVK